MWCIFATNNLSPMSPRTLRMGSCAISTFNDPNWDFQANSSMFSLLSDGVERKRSKFSTQMGASTKVDTESQILSWRIHDSKAEFSSSDDNIKSSECPILTVLIAFCLPTLFH